MSRTSTFVMHFCHALPESKETNVGAEVTIRRADMEDRKTLWEWYNEPLRHVAFLKKQAITYAEHCKWFEGVLRDRDRILCIAMVDNLRIGVVRFDLRGHQQYGASLYLKPSYCGKSYGPPVLAESANYLRSVRRVREVFADVRKVNPASREIFVRAGFVLTREDEGSLHFILTANCSPAMLAGRRDDS